MKRLLCIAGGMNRGGAETFLMKLYRALDKEKYQMDFAVAIKDRGVYDDEIEQLGGKIYHIAPKSQGAMKNFFSIRDIVRYGCYHYVLRVSQNSISALELLAARMGGAKVCAFRSSNSDSAGSKKERVIHSLCRFMPQLFANVKIAPSSEAAKFMFGDSYLKKGKVYLLHNAINLSEFRYSIEGRNNIRKEYGIDDDTKLMGHIGRFNTQKNHMFLLDVFKSVTKVNPNAVLLLVGTGELEKQIKAKVDELGLTEKVIFAGVRSDIPDILSAMDVFVFPSFFEGMPNVVIEAQACGLPCIISDTITREADITGIVDFLPLSTTPDVWAERANSANIDEHFDTKKDLIRRGYDIYTVTDEFIRIVFAD